MAYKRVTEEERRSIYRWSQEGHGQREMARRLERAASSICREMERNRGKRGSSISAVRLAESVSFLRLFRIGVIGFETAEHYARIAADLRARKLLAGLSKPDVWIAASAVEHGAALATRNAKHFENVHNLSVVTYE